MSWVKMDDQWPFHRKLRLVEPLDRLMWAMSIPYASSQNTDGRLDGPMIEMVAFCAGVTKPYEAADRLVAAGLWELDAGGWVVHDYLHFNPSAEKRAQVSEARSEAGRRGGQQSGRTRAKGPTSQPTDKQVASPVLPTSGTPSRPVPSSPVPSSSSGLFTSSVSRAPTDDDDRIAAALPLVAEGLADLYGIANRRRAGYCAAVLRSPDDHTPGLRAIAAGDPHAAPAELAGAYLAARAADEGQPASDQPAPRAPRCGICHGDPHPGGAADCPRLELGPGLLEVSP